MEWYEILIIVLACVFVVGVAVWRIILRKQGKSGCDCGGNCGSCRGCAYCAPQNKK